MTAKIRAVYLDLAAQCRVFLLRRHGFAKLVRHHESRLVLAAQVAAQLQRAHALGAVHEQCNGQQVIPKIHLAAGEYGAAGDAELSMTGLALEDRAGAVGITSHAATVRANRLAVRVGPTNGPKRQPRCFIRHTSNLRHAESAGLGGK